MGKNIIPEKHDKWWVGAALFPGLHPEHWPFRGSYFRLWLEIRNLILETIKGIIPFLKYPNPYPPSFKFQISSFFAFKKMTGSSIQTKFCRC